MNTLFLAATKTAGGGNNIFLIIVFIAIIIFMYFVMIRPQKKQQQQRLSMMDKLKKGDRVVLVDGLHGKIDSVNNEDKTVVIDADGIYLTFSKLAVRQVLPAASATADKPTEEKAAADKSEEKTTETKEAKKEPKTEEDSDK